MSYPLRPSKTQRQILAVLSTARIFDSHVKRTTSQVVACLPGDPGRKRVVDSLRLLETAGYVRETYTYAQGLLGDPNGKLIAWEIMPDGLRVALGVLG